MNKNFTVKLLDDFVVELTERTSTTVFYRFPYETIRKCKDIVPNNFIVYILLGRMDNREEVVYVGKSKNGMENRPASHERKEIKWEYCYIMTEKNNDDSFLNDAIIQYWEDQISNHINESKSRLKYKNITRQTTPGTINKSDKGLCDKVLKQAYHNLYVLGLDLIGSLTLFPNVTTTEQKPVVEKSKLIKKNHSGLNKYTLDDCSNITSLSPKYYVYNHQREYVSSWKEMLCKICHELEKKNRNLFENMARNDYVFDGSTEPFITYNHKILRNACKVSSSGIYIEVNKSANNIVRTINKLFGLFKIDDKAFYFYAE